MLIPALSPLSAPPAAHLFTQHRESSHTDKMLPALCSLFTALSCVSGVTVVTQKPPVLTATKGEKTTMHCNLGTVTGSAARWYKQVPGEAPQYVLYNHHSYSSPYYGSGFSSPKFTSTCSTNSDCSVIISNVELIPALSPLSAPQAAHLFTQHRESSHTDKMLPALCSLFTALSCVSGVTVVTQKPPVLTPTKGETTTMHCNLGTGITNQVIWYKQVPGEAPQYVSRNHHSWSSPEYGSGFSSAKFTSTHSSQSDYSLIISNVELIPALSPLSAPQAAHLFTQHRESSHTDKMLPALCSLFTALSCVSGVTVVTQKPPVLTPTKGETTTMHCNLGTVTGSAACWYKQVPGEAPQYVLSNYHGWSSPNYGSGFSSPKFTSTHSSQSDYTLIISNVELIPALSPLSAPQAAHLFTQHRESSQTDKMLPALCSLFTALSCVSGLTVVTQKPPVFTVTKGETTTMHCNLGTVTNYAVRWYKQLPGGTTQYVLGNYHSWSSPEYASGFSSPKFTSTHSSRSDYTLIISNVEVGDSAVYYCGTHDGSAHEFVSQ
ncbi:hypothetical protein MHYP_G00154390 [Metynnis hypsauchen]